MALPTLAHFAANCHKPIPTRGNRVPGSLLKSLKSEVQMMG